MGLTSLKSGKAESQLLKEGDNIVWMLSQIDCNSNQDVEVRDGKLVVVGLKKTLPKWATPTEQTAVLIGNEAGVCCDRLNWNSWKKPADVTADDGDPNEISVSGDYAVKMINGKLDRIPKGPFDENGINVVCASKGRKFLFALAQGVAEVDGKDLVDHAIANKTPFIANLKKVLWTDPVSHETKTQYRFNEFKPIKDGVVPGEPKKDELVIPEDLAS